MGQTIQLKDHAFNTPLYPITKAENVKLNDERDLVDEIESINGKIESIIQGESELEKYATTEYVDNNLANKADVGHIHQMQDIEGIEELEAQFDNMFEEYTQEQISVDFPNASTISIVDNDDLFTSTTIEGALRELANNSGSGNAEGIKFDNSSNEMTSVNVQDAIEENKTSILNIENELSKSENTKYTTENGIKEFSCKDGYIDNVVIEGETLVNIAPMVVVNGADADGVVRTRFSNLGDNYKFYPRTQKGTFTLMNHTDKSICFVGMTSSDTWAVEGFYVEPLSARVVTLDGSRCINGVDFQPVNGWSNSDLSIYKSSMYSILEGEYDYMPYFEGLKSVGQGDKIEVLTRGAKENIFPSSPSWVDGQYVDGRKKIMPDVSNNASYSYCEQFIDISSYESLYLESGNKFYQFYDESKNPLGIADTNTVEVVMRYNYHNDQKYNNGDFIIKVPSNAKFIRVNSLSSTKDTIKLYGEYKYDKKQILTTLRSLPNGVKDTIEKRGNNKIKRCGEITLSGNENITIVTTTDVNVFNISCDLGVTSIITILSDRYKTLASSGKEEGILYDYSNKRFRVSTNKFSTINDFKNDLKSNPITVVYELATPVIEELPNFNPQTFSDKTTLLLNSGVVQGEASFEVTNSLGSELEVLKDKVSNLDDYVVDKEVYYPTLLNGWVKSTTSYGALRFERQGKLVTVNCRIKSGITTSGTIIAQLPSRFIATEVVVVPCFNGKAQSGRVFFTEVGNVTIFNVESNTDLYFNFSYYVK